MEVTDVAVEAFAAETGTTPVVGNQDVDVSVANNKQKFYTDEDLAKVRSQEKDKLYPVIEQLKEQVSALTKEKEEKAARKAEKAAQEAAEKEAKQKAKLEESLDAKEFAKLTADELREQLERERQERETAFALLERERQYADLTNYRTQRVDQEREAIIPELVDLIAGNTREEVDQSIESLKERSARILESAQSAMQNARKEMTGTRATLPPAGPLETNMEQRPLTAQDIASMSMNDYAKYRDRILSETARGKTKGLFG